MMNAFLFAALTLAASPLPSPTDDPPAISAPAEKSKVYDESADAKSQIAAAVKNAKAEHRRVLIQWGGNWCPWCLRLHGLYQTDASIRKQLLYEYDVVYVDTGGKTNKNMDLAKSYGADVAKQGFPYLTVLDEDGKVVVNQETAALEVKGGDGNSKGVEAGHDPQRVLEFLKKHQAPYLKAETLLHDAVGRAKAEGKTAFVHFGAPWCIWCHRLEEWMARPAVSSVLSKDFVLVKIDTDRTQGGQAMLESMAGSKSGGIPWIAMVDGAGKTVVNGNSKEGNIGFPAQDGEIAYFESMLNKTRRDMTEADVKALTDSLREYARTLKH